MNNIIKDNKNNENFSDSDKGWNCQKGDGTIEAPNKDDYYIYCDNVRSNALDPHVSFDGVFNTQDAKNWRTTPKNLCEREVQKLKKPGRNVSEKHKQLICKF